MEPLFSTNISVNNQNIRYRVVFDREKYNFLSEAGKHEFSSFSFRREHDEWQADGSIPDQIKNQAIEALDKYLMKQH